MHMIVGLLRLHFNFCFFLCSLVYFYQFCNFFFLFPNKLLLSLYQVLAGNISLCSPGKSIPLHSVTLIKMRLFYPPLIGQHLSSRCINLKIKIFSSPSNFCSCTYFRLEDVSFLMKFVNFYLQKEEIKTF